MTLSPPVSPGELLRRPSYVVLLVIGVLVGVPVAGVAYVFLLGDAQAQQYVFTTLPTDIGFAAAPAWWPIPLLSISGLLVGLIIR